MSENQPVIVFHGRTEFEAQMARDTLQSAMIPLIHVPSLSTGIFGTARPTRVAVPAEFVEQSIEVLKEAGFDAKPEKAPHGVEEFAGAVQDTFPATTSSGSPRFILVVGFVLIAALVFFGRGCFQAGS
ncbi:MAG: hypothetical protein HKN21_04445 [Candidatus Eisenbacteria bacterium]|uniref:DUF2007 domain-containing protein n=1 Tax=Eiseniibacteriota bacterium TaxID=2212470 RepID=A0A7Y2E7X5_UNCEI|nr:hypothetical protein [Candidatus Eisenbacteria bacterium]